ncbi:hypothetical protein BJY00DRAFT_287999 [Aspergillus carlsbadensis]|nr:hypothetical protein BJY00DRAFT_287999 [Aspergillus carlsbadensis]
MEQSHVCGFEGNSDLYGLGIRLGIYTQWLASYFVSLWRTQRITQDAHTSFSDLYLRLFLLQNGLVENYVIFLLALVVTMMTSKARAEPTHAVDILILTYIIFGGMMVLMGNRFPVKFLIQLESLVHPALIIAAGAIYTRAAVFCSWFWLRGVHDKDSLLETPCGTAAFIFARVSLYNSSLLRFFGVISIIVGVTSCFTIVVPVIVFYSITDDPNPPPSGASPDRNATDDASLRSLEVPVYVEGRPRYQLILSTRYRKYHEKYGRLYKFLKFGNLLKIPTWREPTRAAMEELNVQGTPGPQGEPEQLRLWGSTAIFPMIYSIAGVELTLYWNTISGVYSVSSTGQLIPLIIGATSLVRTVYGVLKLRNEQSLLWREYYEERRAATHLAMPPPYRSRFESKGDILLRLGQFLLG